MRVFRLCRSPRGNVDWNAMLESQIIQSKVVPHAGTWIEIFYKSPKNVYLQVVPHAGTWIEMCCQIDADRFELSFPTRERGLKSLFAPPSASVPRRSPRGNVDWNPIFNPVWPWKFVVPHAGTWIEIKKAKGYKNCMWSFPTRERGLKWCYLHVL